MFLEISTGNSSKDYSEATAREIDNEIKEIVEKSYVSVKTLLNHKRALLERVAQTLLQKEVLEGEDLRRLIKEDGESNVQS
jgi:cell division protease FtsH